MTTQEQSSHLSRIIEILENGSKVFFLSDNDDKEWESGFAEYLLNNYEYENKRTYVKVYLTKKVKHNN